MLSRAQVDRLSMHSMHAPARAVHSATYSSRSDAASWRTGVPATITPAMSNVPTRQPSLSGHMPEDPAPPSPSPSSSPQVPATPPTAPGPRPAAKRLHPADRPVDLAAPKKKKRQGDGLPALSLEDPRRSARVHRYPRPFWNVPSSPPGNGPDSPLLPHNVECPVTPSTTAVARGTAQ